MQTLPTAPGAAVVVLVLDAQNGLLAAYARRAGCGSADTAQPGLTNWLPQADDRERALWLALRDSLLQDAAGSSPPHTTRSNCAPDRNGRSDCAMPSRPDSGLSFLVVLASGGNLFVEHIRAQLNPGHLRVRGFFNRNAVMRRDTFKANTPVTYLRLGNTLPFHADQFGQPALASNDKYGFLNWGHSKPS